MSLIPKRGIILPTLRQKHTPNRSTRHGAKVRLIVVHSTEGSYAGAVSWLCQARAQASAHIVVREDGKEATQLVPLADKAWHVAAYNPFSVGVECAGHSGKLPDAQLRVVARIVAYLLHYYGLPARYVGGNVAKSGWTLHQALGMNGGGHHDPGFSLARRVAFGALVRWELRRGGFRRSWAR